MKEIKNVVILGGGTAGWLAAYIMSDFFYSNKLNAHVKVIESSKIPTIGVGEGTTSIFYEFLKFEGLKSYQKSIFFRLLNASPIQIPTSSTV